MAFQWTSKNQAQNGVEDMVLLSKVTNDQIAENLKKRINSDLMYTYIGPTLVAVNPYKKMNYFTEKEMDQYHGAAAYELPPHIYAVADRMFQNMIADEENQCVIISGESGAGKTESAKLIMNYIASVSGKGGNMNNVVDNVKKIILESNPLLESFGNAKTLRNNNSSRFGKYFEIDFTRGGAPVGGRISNFLLEKSRVVGPGVGERNFHVFYQITKAASQFEKEQLGMMSPEYFRYLNCSGEYDADGIDDKQEYADMRAAMNVCNFQQQDQASILEILASILHLGNIDFIEDGNQAVADAPEALAFPAFLLGVSEETLKAKLTSRIMTTGGMGKRSSSYEVPLNVEQARNTRDALAKALYSRMFDWIVHAVNAAMKSLSDTVKSKNPLCVGVLDIFGFEIFEKNGFEQFCINYVNERLQQIFIELTLKSEQEEYRNEGIQWTPIDYFNNKIVVDLIESKRPPGIMAVLDDVCFTMHAQTDGADVKFVQKLGMSCSQNKHFEGLATQFKIHHYAGTVVYDCDGFTESNKDTLFKDLIMLMQSTNKKFIRDLFPEQVDEDSRKRPTTVSHKIKNQCQDLVDTLMKCTPSYVRCIKPNETKRPRDWDTSRVEHQVRYLNLKENIIIRRAGFCYRNTFDKFLRRFAILTPETFPRWNGDVATGIQKIMNSVSMDAKEWQIGSTKLFIKSPESLFLLEESRDRKYHGYAVIIQRAWRKYKSQKYFIEMRKKAADIVFGKKERKRASLSREFVGDYLNFLGNVVLRSLVDKKDKVLFADICSKYDRKMKATPRELLVSESFLYIIGTEKAKDGPNKDKLIKVVKRKIPYNQINVVSVSSKMDDFVVLHVQNDYDTILESVFKTELITVLAEQYLNRVGRPLALQFSDRIRYTVKKTTWQRGGTQDLEFIYDNSCLFAVLKSGGKTTQVRIREGLPKDSRPMNSRRKIPATTQSSNGYNSSQLGGGYQHQTSSRFPVSSAPMNNNPSQQHVFPAYAATGSSNGRGSFNQGGSAAPTNNMASIVAAKRRPPPVPPQKKLPTCKALYEYQAQEADELSIREGDIISIISKGDVGWWTGTLNGKKGLFPANYVQEL